MLGSWNRLIGGSVMDLKVYFIGEVKFTNPCGSVESLAVYRSPTGGIFAIDSSYIEQDVDPAYDPLTGAQFDLDESESE